MCFQPTNDQAKPNNPTKQSMNIELIEFATRGDQQGLLIPIEARRQVPFSIERIYYIFGTQPGVRRGKHAHRQLQQMAVCLRGSCRFHMDDGNVRQEFVLNRLDRGLPIEPMIWHEMDEFSADCILLVLASSAYDEKDYIRDYGIFCREVNGNG